MEPEIRPVLPPSSPFLAYGESRGPFSGRNIVLIAAAVIGTLITAGILWILFGWRIPYPAEASVLATFGPGPRHGYVLEKGRVSRFDLTLFGRMSDPERARSGPVKLFAEEPITLTTVRVIDILALWNARFTGEGYAVARTPDGTFVRGVIVNSEWRTDLHLRSSEMELPQMELAIDIGALPEAWSEIATALEPSGLELRNIDPPTVFGYSMTTGTLPNISFGYANGVPHGTALAVAALAGLTDRRLATLSDGETAEELFLPEALLQDASSTLAATSGTGIFMEERRVGILTAQSVEGTSCGDRTVFRLSGFALETVLEAWHLPQFNGTSVRAGEKNGKLVVCLH